MNSTREKKKTQTARHMEKVCVGGEELIGKTWHELSSLAQDCTGWKRFIDALCSSQSEEDFEVSKYAVGAGQYVGR